MKNLNDLNQYRLDVRSHPNLREYEIEKDTSGVFVLPSPIDGQDLRVIADSGGDWDHVSVSRLTRCPNWIEMDFIKRKFFKDDEVAMQLHVTPRDHINCHPNVLHIWRHQHIAIPLPPKELV